MSRRPFLVLGIASFFVVLVAAWLPLSKLWMLCGIAAAVLVFGVLLCRRSIGKSAIGGALAAALILASLAAKCVCTIVPQAALAEQTAFVTMRVYDSAQISTGTTYVVKAESGDLPRGTRLFLWAGNIGVHPKTGDLLEGYIDVHAAVREDDPALREYASQTNTWLYAWPSDGHALMWSDGRNTMPLLQKVLAVCRESIQAELYRYLPPVYAALCESVLLGERDRLDETMSEHFRASGVYHVLAVSGLHLTVITGVVLALTRRLKRRVATVITMAAVLMFMALCDFSPSVSRAGVMMLIVLSGRLFRRRADGLNSLGLAAFVMLLVDPLCGYDIGWQLSFAATLGLLCGYPVWHRAVTARAVASCPSVGYPLSVFLSTVGVTVCASWATMPLLALYFGEVSTVFLLSNLVCIPLATMLLVLTLCGVLITMVWESVGVGVLVLCERLCLWLDNVTAVIASFPFATVKTTHPLVALWLFAFVAVTTIGYVVDRRRGVPRSALAMVCALLVGVAAFQMYDRNTVHITVVDTDAPVVIVDSPHGIGMVFAGDDDAIAATKAVLDREHIDTLDWLVWADTTDTRRCQTAFNDIAVTTVFAENTIPFTHPDVRKTEPDTAIAFNSGTMLEFAYNAYRLTVDDIAITICCADADPAAIAAWTCSDLLVLSGKLDAKDVFPAANVAVVSDSWFTLEDNKESVSDRYESVYFTAEEDALTFLSRQNAKLILRAY